MRVIALAVITIASSQLNTHAFSSIKAPSLLQKRPARIASILRNEASPVAEKESASTDMNEILFNDIDDTATKIENVRGSLGFRNDGKYWFFKTAMGVYEEGSEVVNGVPMKRDDSKPLVSEEEAAKRRIQATEELVNIDDSERQRRIDLGNTFLIVSAVYAGYLALFLDQGDLLGHLIRFSVFPLYSAGYGLRASGKAGLWNIAQVGLWDVEGNGLSRIEDRSLALALLEKVNSFNDFIFFSSIIPPAIFAILPIEKVSAFAAFGLFLSVFSFAKSKFPIES